MNNVYARSEKALLERDPACKCALVFELFEDYRLGKLVMEDVQPILPIDDPGRPQKPCLVDPRRLSRRSTATDQGRIHLLHSFAHIEFCAINIALDAVYRFRQMPDQYISDWLLVASEEANHFQLLDSCLQARGSFYGDCDAHSGLWDMVCKTRHDVLHRMAMVPRVMEARGLDVTPGMIKRFRQAGDEAAVDILSVIYEDEIGHVRIGNHWYQSQCEQRQLDSRETFQTLVDEYLGGQLRGPFNREARCLAGFDTAELDELENVLR